MTTNTYCFWSLGCRPAGLGLKWWVAFRPLYLSSLRDPGWSSSDTLSTIFSPQSAKAQALAETHDVMLLGASSCGWHTATPPTTHGSTHVHAPKSMHWDVHSPVVEALQGHQAKSLEDPPVTGRSQMLGNTAAVSPQDSAFSPKLSATTAGLSDSHPQTYQVAEFKSRYTWGFNCFCISNFLFPIACSIHQFLVASWGSLCISTRELSVTLIGIHQKFN